MTNMTEMQAAAVAVCDASAALNNGRAMMAVAIARNLDMALVATVNGKAVPFTLRDYAFKPMTDGKSDGKLRNAQFAAIMSQGFGEPEETADVEPAVKTAFNATFGAALWLDANGGAAMADDAPEDFGGVTLGDCQFHSVPLAFAFGCFNREGSLTDNGKTVVERVIAMFSPDKGPELTQEQAIDLLFEKRVDAVGGAMNRRYGLKTVTVTDLIADWKRAAINDGLMEGGKPRAGRTNQPPAPSETIKAFDTFLDGIKGKDGESRTTLNENGIKALKALKAKLEATIKALA